MHKHSENAAQSNTQATRYTLGTNRIQIGAAHVDCENVFTSLPIRVGVDDVAYADPQHAAYIVQVCNAHEALVLQLERALSAIETPGDLDEDAREYLIDDIAAALQNAGSKLWDNGDDTLALAEAHI